ncbi:hypothetical protein [Ruminococcus bicirculans (ex Wegman et al. 2014)]|jgi:hypothetical protein|uniref:hypothetical protein n=1 Tax=Ruminococcus bicirculans (ex Wegman et al. 2014) TaxID=1160721 RepID=UPI001644C176|nr:hypothetical protein [Ruminococcus bicirculans (ex Wegman et al. 2014)]MBC3513208.1 hypothetical protein [Ruminococcus bicirculans (ex Wegman et al. 2014)]
MTSIKALYRFNLSPTSPKSPGQASDPSQKASIRCPRFSALVLDFCCHHRKTADDKDIEQIKQTMLERVESIEPRIRDYAEEWLDYYLDC